MNILIVSQYYQPEQFLINEIAPELVARGNEVTVLTGLPNYPEGKVLDRYRHGKKRDEVIDGVRVIRCNETGRRKGPLFLFLNYLSFSFFTSRKAKKMKEKYDVIMCYQLSPVTMVNPAIAYKKLHNTPLLIYCLDLWPESAQAHVHSDKGFLYKKITELSNRIYSYADRIAVTSKPFIDYFENVNGVSRDKLTYIPQHADARMMGMELTAHDNGVADFMYAGNFGYGQTLEVIVKAAALLKQRNDFKVHFVGDGSCLEMLKTLVRENEIEDKVIFHGRHSFADMPDFYRKADALLITLRGNNFVGNTMPGKLQTYMTAGKPIFGAINGSANEVIKEAQCGDCVASGDYKGLAKLMEDFIEKPHKYDECGKNARKYFNDNFTKEKYVDSIENELKKLCELTEVKR